MTLDDNIFKDVFFGPYSSFNSPLTPVSKMLASFDGIQSGIPTRTTSTLTPTTLRNIEQTFYELTNESSSSVPCQAGFVAPLPSFQFEQDIQDQDQDQDIQDHDQDQDQENSLGSSADSNTSESWPTPPSSSINEDLTIETIAPKSRRNMGGRRPKHAANLSPEEEEKRKLRRERNKMAAARCRKRRVDQTNELVDKVNLLEKEKQKLQNDIQELQVMKEDLQFCLESHRAQCRITINIVDRKSPMDFKPPHPHMLLVDKIKIEPMDNVMEDDLPLPPPPKKLMLSTANPTIGSVANQSLNTPTICKPNRPMSLNVPMTMTPSQALGMNKNIADMAGVQITTPSTGVCSMFNFDSLMDGGTGLTPVSQPLMPTCSTQNKNPMDLVTPTSEPSKLVSL